MYYFKMTEPSATTIDIWIKLSRSYQAILSFIEASLKQAELPPLSWYDVLLELDRVASTAIRPFELQEKLLLPQYSLSRLLNKIEKAGYLQRLPCNEDGRGQRVVITREGKTMRKRMWAVYGAALEQAVGSKVAREDREKLLGLLKLY